ncbi:meiosis inhibitor protein 1 [Stegastes partitus]|uniref:Meiosis inhibitor protein 1 n=1 Tax=Stegastes partitus TaxID=144197 RepID=A0A9Y4NJX8_9TELE|nr:PREDICTED: meiosis inhibitor protein 1 [Stegastes partitus]
MTSGDIVYDKIHFRHDPKWSGRVGPAEGGGPLLCVACVVEMMESDHIAAVRKSSALSGVSGVLKCCPGALRELLQQDHRVSLHFTATLLGMLQTVEDPVTLEKVDQVLIQLLVELQSELSFRFVLDEVHKQLSDQHTVKRFLPTLTFLGNLVKAVPNVAHSLVTQYVPLLDHLCSTLLYPDEAFKTSVLYVWLQLLGTPGGSVTQALPTGIRDRLCVLLLQTLGNADSPPLIRNCVGLLWQLVQQGEAVSALMNSQMMCDENEDILANDSQILSQNQEQQPPDHCPLPLILKKLLLSGDETLQVTSAKCMAAVLVHSPSQYGAPFIKADVPEFLFDCLASSSSEALLWSVYSCLLLLTEDTLFFSQCHSVYGIESLVRSLNEALRLTNPEVPKQGLLLLTEILERQPPSVHLFPSGPGFVAVSEAVLAGVSCSCLLVATQAASAASALFRLNHQSRPVQYKEVEGLIETITSRFSELPPPSAAHRKRISGSLKRLDPSSQPSKSERFLLQALVCFQAACRLAEECASEPALRENTFTAPYKNNNAQDSLESLCQCLLRCCDSVWIPTVIKVCERAASAGPLQYFYSILSSQFTLLPPLMPAFANKLASSGFYRLAVEHKGLFCAGNRNPDLNAACCGFLQKLSVCLLSQSDPASGSDHHDVEEVENLLRYNLPSLCCHLSDWPSLLSEYKGQRAAQYCLVIMLCLALQHGDRLLPDQTVFSSVVWLLHSVQEQGSCALPPSVLRSALYLLAVTQDKNPSLDRAPLNCVSKALSCQSFSSLYFHHPALLHFICGYPDLANKFGPLVLELWLTKQAQHPDAEQITADVQRKGEKRESHANEAQDQEPDLETMELLTLIDKHPAVILTLLDMVCTREAPLAERVLGVMEVFLHGQRDYDTDLCTSLRAALLQALQRVSVENVGHRLGQGHTAQAVNSLPLLLKLLCVTQACDPPSNSPYSEMEGAHFKLLYHVSNIAARLKPTNTESLLPALSYLYCCLSLPPAHCTDRAVSMLLSNSGLMDQLQTVLSSSSSCAPSLSPPPPCPPLALLCCCHLLLSSLITLQRVHSAQVHKSISWSLDTTVQRLLVQKRNTDNLLLVSYLRLLQALLDADLASAVVSVSSGPGLVGPKPLGVEDGALYPLGSRGAQSLSTALSGLLLQKHELLLRASVNCLSSLLGFVQRKSPTTAKYVVCQPWSGFLLRCLLSSGENCLLHPAILRLITLLLQDSSTTVLWEPDLLQVMEAVERRGVKELSQEAAQALRLLLTQIQSGVRLPTEELKQRAEATMEALGPNMPVMNCSPSLPSSLVRVGGVSVCLSDFTLKPV